MTSDRQIVQLARRLGIAITWQDAFGKPQAVGIETLRAMIAALGDIGDGNTVEPSLQPGEGKRSALPLVTCELRSVLSFTGPLSPRCRFRHEDGETVDLIAVDLGDGRWSVPPLPRWGYWANESGGPAVAVAPPRCFGVADALGRTRGWGLAAQLYSLRGAGDCGVGTYASLGALAGPAAAMGADVLAVSPAHAMFAARPGQYSPYSPSNRLLLNWLYGDAVRLGRRLGVPADADFECRRRAAADLPLVDWPRASGLVMEALRRGFARISASGTTETGRFARFRREQGAVLQAHACFEALQAQAAAEGRDGNWRTWAPGLQAPGAPEVALFAGRQAEAVSLHAFAQWCVHEDRAAAQAACRSAGMAVGLVADLAVGVDPAGSQVWSHRSEFLEGLSIGAPPDLFNLLGQSWGLAAFSPRALRATGFAPFIALLRAVLRDAGGVRIDHILGLQRLWLVPEGMDAARGAYLAYPLDDLLRLLKIESWRHRAIVIGEDLGTVPPGFRRSLARAGVLGTQVLWFEREDDGGFRVPQRWSRHAIGMTTTHDLPTVAGWWRGRDIELRRDLDLFPTADQATQAAIARTGERPALWRAFCEAGIAAGSVPAPDHADAVVEAASGWLGRTRAPLVLLPLEDAVGTPEQPNLPGTIDSHPNWRRRFAVGAADLLDDPAVARRLRAVGQRRSRAASKGRSLTKGRP